MKMLFTLLPLCLACSVLADEAKPNLDDPAARGKILAQAIDWGELEERGKEGEELLYAPNSQTPYTGWVKAMYDNGKVEGLAHFKNGKLHGLSTWWYENGQKLSKTNWKDGEPYGLGAWWHENGQKSREVNYVDGKPHGLETYWYENGQKEFETNRKDGKLHGLWAEWYDNGQKKKESQYENGKEVAASLKRWHSNGEIRGAIDDAINNLKQMFFLLFEYDQDEGAYPDDLQDLQKDGYTDSLEEINHCMINGKKTKFAYRSGFSAGSNSKVILMYTPKPIDGKMAYLSNDGSVKTLPTGKFEELLNAQK